MQLFKHCTIIIFLCAVNFTSLAQIVKPVVKPAPVTDSVAKQMCTCISFYKDSITTRQQLFTVLQNCLQQHALPVMDALLAEDGFVQTDDRKTRAAAMRAIGQKMGAKVLAECPGIKQLIDAMNNEAPKKELH
jgi:hypothetical protein